MAGNFDSGPRIVWDMPQGDAPHDGGLLIALALMLAGGGLCLSLPLWTGLDLATASGFGWVWCLSAGVASAVVTILRGK